MTDSNKYYVIVRTDDLAYGGPEEGGWWYSVHDLAKVSPRTFDDIASAYAYADRLYNRLKRIADRQGIYSVNSVSYQGGRYDTTVLESHDRLVPHWPVERPHHC